MRRAGRAHGLRGLRAPPGPGADRRGLGEAADLPRGRRRLQGAAPAQGRRAGARVAGAAPARRHRRARGVDAGEHRRFAELPVLPLQLRQAGALHGRARGLPVRTPDVRQAVLYKV